MRSIFKCGFNNIFHNCHNKKKLIISFRVHLDFSNDRAGGYDDAHKLPSSHGFDQQTSH
jgi:hypothetical protein